MNGDGDTSAGATVVRRATDGDEPGIVELNRIHNGEDGAAAIRSAFDAGHLAPDDFAVAVAGSRVVSVVGLLPMALSVGDVVLPVGQPEFIATDPAFRGRGLVRQLLDLVHGWSADRGDLWRAASPARGRRAWASRTFLPDFTRNTRKIRQKGGRVLDGTIDPTMRCPGSLG